MIKESRHGRNEVGADSPDPLGQSKDIFLMLPRFWREHWPGKWGWKELCDLLPLPALSFCFCKASSSVSATSVSCASFYWAIPDFHILITFSLPKYWSHPSFLWNCKNSFSKSPNFSSAETRETLRTLSWSRTSLIVLGEIQGEGLALPLFSK